MPKDYDVIPDVEESFVNDTPDEVDLVLREAHVPGLEDAAWFRILAEAADEVASNVARDLDDLVPSDGSESQIMELFDVDLDADADLFASDDNQVLSDPLPVDPLSEADGDIDGWAHS